MRSRSTTEASQTRPSGPCPGEPAIRVCVLETVSISRVQDPIVVEIGSMQQKVMLTLLVAYRNRSVSVDRIAEELWGDDKPRRWLASIRTLANSLRRVCGDRDFIHWTGRGYRLHARAEAVDTDVDQMMAAVDDARLAFAGGRVDAAEAAARVALSLYGNGPWTTDCWYWSDLAAEAYSLLGRALLADGNHLRCLLELSLAPEELEWHEGVATCLQQAKEAVGASAG